MFKTLSAKAASLLDQELMSSGSFSIDQLMELAGLAVAKAVYKQYPPRPSVPRPKVLVLVGPGNNGGDGLVCARHLKLWKTFEPVVFYPKRPQKELYLNLMKQLHDLGVEEVAELDDVKALLHDNSVSVIIDAIFGFSFHPPIREPFGDLLSYLAASSKEIAPIVSIDIPSGWDVDEGPIDTDIGASMLVSLTAPKPCARKFVEQENKVHYLGGRFINDTIAAKYDLEELISRYSGDELIVKL